MLYRFSLLRAVPTPTAKPQVSRGFPSSGRRRGGGWGTFPGAGRKTTGWRAEPDPGEGGGAAARVGATDGAVPTVPVLAALFAATGVLAMPRGGVGITGVAALLAAHGTLISLVGACAMFVVRGAVLTADRWTWWCVAAAVGSDLVRRAT